MGEEENKATLVRFIEEVFNKGRTDALDEFVTSDFTRHAMGGTTSGRQILVDAVTALRTGFPDFHVSIEDMLAGGDKVAQRQVHTGTHLGEFAGVKPTGRRIETTEVSIARFQDGKIAEAWVNVDQLTMLRQIGALPS